METLKKSKTVNVYANPVTKLGFPAKAQILEVIKDYGSLQCCKVRMIESGMICNVFVNLQP